MRPNPGDHELNRLIALSTLAVSGVACVAGGAWITLDGDSVVGSLVVSAGLVGILGFFDLRRRF